MDVLEEILEEIFSFLIASPKMPKPIRYVLVTALAVFIIAIGMLAAIQSESLVGSIFGFGLIAFGIVSGIFLAVKIYRN